MEDYEKKWKQKVNVNLKACPEVICKACKNQYFKPLVKIRIVSPLLMGSTHKTYAMQQFFECSKCQAIISIEYQEEDGIELMPADGRKTDLRKEQQKDKIK